MSASVTMRTSLRCQSPAKLSPQTGSLPSHWDWTTIRIPAPEEGAAMDGLPIGDYALLSDCHSAALVSRDGSVDWLCFPRFDGPSLFCRLLDSGGGRFAITPTGEFQARRRYADETMVLETTFTTTGGAAVLTDAMAVGPDERGHELGKNSPG